MRIKQLIIRLLFILANFAIIAHAQPANTSRELSLDDAILLAVRENPNVQQSQLNHVMQKFALELQQWQFKPHYSVQATRSYTSTTTNGVSFRDNLTNIQPGVSLNTPIGTQATLTNANNIGGTYSPALSLQVTQPLMRGFGKPIVEAALYNAMDSEKVSRLNVEGTLRATVTSVINAYLDVVSAQHTLQIDQQALERAEKSVQQTKLFIKAGHKAGVELITVQAEVATAKTRIEADKNSLDQSRYALLTTIGLDPNTPVKLSNIDIDKLMHKYHVPTLTDSKEMVLANDIQYQVDQITLHGSLQRSLAQAQDNTRWQLNLTVQDTLGTGTSTNSNGVNGLLSGHNETRNASLNLTIPIDDQNAKVAVANAKIAIREANIALQQEKWTKETSAINEWNSIVSSERSLNLAQSAEQLQTQTYHMSFKKYSFGLIDSLELQTAQQQLISAQQTLSNARISYLKALVNLDSLIGNTLKTWNIKVRYS